MFYKAAAIALFALLLVPVAGFAGGVYEEAAGKNKLNAWNKQRFDDFYDTDPHSLDMVFLGSSHSYCTFDPENIYESLGLESFQLGMPLQLPDATFYTLQEVLNTQSPKTVVMELYWDVMNIDFDMKQADALFKVLRNDELKDEYFKNVFPVGEKAKYNIKAIRFQQDFFAYENTALLNYMDEEHSLKRTIKQFDGEEYYRSKGYIYCDYVMSDEEYAKITSAGTTDGRRWKMSAAQRRYLLNIAQLCDESGVDLIFVTAPISNVAFRNIKHYETIHKQVAALAAELDAPYLDFNIVNQNEQLFEDEHFRDKNHLNDNGVKVADAYFADWFISLD